MKRPHTYLRRKSQRLMKERRERRWEWVYTIGGRKYPLMRKTYIDKQWSSK